MHVPTRGRSFWERSDRTRGCLIFELVVHRALRVHHFVRVALVRGKSFAWGVSVLFLALALEFSLLSLLFQRDCVERYLCL